jgi:hypothetical protein
MSRLYKSYVFRDRDPVIDELRTVMEDSLGRKFTKKDAKTIEEDGGPKRGTVINWFWGTTKRPQSATLEAAGRAAGFRRTWVRLNGKGK